MKKKQFRYYCATEGDERFSYKSLKRGFGGL